MTCHNFRIAKKESRHQKLCCRNEAGITLQPASQDGIPSNDGNPVIAQNHVAPRNWSGIPLWTGCPVSRQLEGGGPLQPACLVRGHLGEGFRHFGAGSRSEAGITLQPASQDGIPSNDGNPVIALFSCSVLI